jgi:outer membrane protein
MLKKVLYLTITLLLLGLPMQALGQQATSTAGETLTLEQAIAMALGENRQLRNVDLEAEKYNHRIAATRALRLPAFKFSAQASYLLTPLNFTFKKGQFGDFPGTGPIPNEDTTISSPRSPTLILSGQVIQPLSQLYQINLNIKSLEVGKQIAGQQTRQQRQAIINNVKRTYYAILQTQSSLSAVEESIQLYKELDRVTDEYVAQQVALKADSLAVQTRLAKAEYEALNLNNTLTTQKEQLNHLLGRDIGTAFEISAVLANVNFESDLAAARQRAFEQRPEIQEARLKIKQATLDMRAKKAEFIPEVSLGVNYLSPRNFDSIVPQNFASVGITVSWEIFDWGRRKNQLAEKQKTYEQSNNSLKESESLVLMEVNNQYRQLQQTRSLLRTAQMSQATERENLRVATNRYNLQAALLKDVLESQARLADANHQYKQALLSFWTARADFEKTIGEDQ